MNIFLKSSRVKTLTLVFRGCTILNLISVLNNVYLHLSVCNNSQINTAQKIPAQEGTPKIPLWRGVGGVLTEQPKILKFLSTL